MVVGYYGAVTKELRRLGFAYLNNAKGSHEKWQHPDGKIVVVPGNLVKRHTANGILKDAGSKLHL